MLTRLILRNNLALMSKGVNEITIDPMSMFNIIIGRNGQGKTTILREISPLPPENAEYGDDGYKEIVYTFPNRVYRLVSHTGKKSTHYFYLNNENLNSGMTLRVQQELVRLHFGITPEIKNVISGIDRSDLFTSLPLARRKQLLMDINPNDTSFVLKVYDKLKVNHNQTKGALKHQRQRLSAELQRQQTINATPIEELRYEVSQLDGEIKTALIAHGTLSSVKDPDLTPLVKKLDNIMIDILRVNEKITQPISWYEHMVETSGRLIEHDRQQEKTLIAFINNITDKINNVTPTDGLTTAEYESRIAEVKKEVDELGNKKNGLLHLIMKTPFFATKEWDNTSFFKDVASFKEHLVALEVTPDEEMSASVFTHLLESRKQLEREVDALKREIDKAQHTLRHYHQAEQVNCPECKAGFKLGFENIKLADVTLRLEKLNTNKEKKEERLRRVSTRIDESEPWYYGMLAMMKRVKHSQCANYFVDIIRHFNVGKKLNPGLINSLNMMIEYHHTVQTEEERKHTLAILEGHFRLINESEVKNLYLNLERLNEELSIVQRAINRRKRDIISWNNIIEEISSRQLLITSYRCCFDDLFNQLVEKGKYVIKQAVQERIQWLTPKRDQLVTDIIRSESLNCVVDSIQVQVDELEKREKHLAYLLDKLSPTKGFIGHLMLDFINSFCANINAAVSKIWTEPLKLLSPDFEEDDLDYKFRVVTTDAKRPIVDIKRCSGGEKDIIDFSIRAVLLRYLGPRSGLILVMDEIGSTFDELHRLRFSNYISTESRIGKLPQIVMVSHYISQYGAFKSNEVNTIALNAKGITTPEHANKNVVIM